MRDGTGTPFVELSEKLAKAEAERDAAREESEHFRAGMGAFRDERNAAERETFRLKARAEAAEATSRALHFEEAARRADAVAGVSPGPSRIAEAIRDLAPLPAGLVVVPVEVLGRARKAGGDVLEFLANEYGNTEGNDWANEEASSVADELDAALEALTKERK